MQQTSEYNRKEADSQIQRTNQWLTGGRGMREISGSNDGYVLYFDLSFWYIGV